MTQMETVQRAKRYMDKLAQGIDPITGREMPEDATLNNVRLTRCFFYVADVLQRVIDNGGTVGNEPKKYDFCLTKEQIAQFPISEEPLRISQFVDLLYRAAENPEMKKLKTTAITNWFLDKGFMRKEDGWNGKQRRVPTDAGRSIGLSLEVRHGMYGAYTNVYYDGNAQRFVLDNLDAILRESKPAYRG